MVLLQGGSDYKEILKKEGLKSTKHRNAILGIMEEGDEPLTAEAVFLKLKDMNTSISLSTVYRILETLVSKGVIIKSSVTCENKAVFEMNRMEHKHHLVCTGCKRMVSVEGCPFEEYEKKLKGLRGFDITGHKLEIYGVCPDCKR
ncbi:MAG: transcriptional repressor [Clostridia bacterium]|nr:transcriptional repressor [Clostridia bacterium]